MRVEFWCSFFMILLIKIPLDNNETLCIDMCMEGAFVQFLFQIDYRFLLTSL